MSIPNNNTNCISQSEEQYIKELKLKLHNSFLEISQLQELHEEEIKELKSNYEEKIKKLQHEKQEALSRFNKSNRICQIDDKADEYFSQVDYSIISPKFHKFVSSFLQEQQNLPFFGNILQSSKNLDDNSLITIIQEKQNIINNQYKVLPNAFQQYIGLVQQLTKQNIYFKQKIKKALSKCEKDSEKINELQKKLILLNKGQVRLKQDNLRLTSMYKSQFTKASQLQNKLHNLERKMYSPENKKKRVVERKNTMDSYKQ